jgi:hypothetical protein
LFGSKNFSIVVDLPNRLSNLVAVMPPGHRYTTDRFIDDHTLLPFYAPFLPPGRLQLIREDMQGAQDNRIHGRVGIKAGGFRLPERLRFCPSCVEEDREKFSETYWHRLHQVTGVEVCPQHRTFLESSDISWALGGKRRRHSSAERAVCRATPRPLDMNNTSHTLLLKIASESFWLLNSQDTGLDNNILRERYYNLLLERGYGYYNGRIRATKLLKAFLEFYPAELLSTLQCTIKHSNSCWLLRLLLPSQIPVAHHPIRHLLLIIFLKCTTKQLFTSHEKFKPFGDGPWTCFNHAASHFGKLSVTKCQVVDSLVKGKPARPMGIFSCACGFIYTRMGPDLKEHDQFRVDSVRAYGPVWENSLKVLWENSSITAKKAAQTLGVEPATVTRHAIKLGLKYPRNKSHSKTTGGEINKRYLIVRQTPETILEERRNQWISIINANNNANRKQLIKVAYYLYFWLKRNDSEWFTSHLPTRTHHRLPAHNLIDWKSIDPEFAAAVRKSITRIRNLPAYPVRASITAVIRDVGHQSWIERHLDQLPLTKAAINEGVECNEAYSFRKINWAESHFRQEKRYPTRLQFEVLANVRNMIGKTTPVQSAIDNAMARLKQHL